MVSCSLISSLPRFIGLFVENACLIRLDVLFVVSLIVIPMLRKHRASHIKVVNDRFCTENYRKIIASAQVFLRSYCVQKILPQFSHINKVQPHETNANDLDLGITDSVTAMFWHVAQVTLPYMHLRSTPCITVMTPTLIRGLKSIRKWKNVSQSFIICYFFRCLPWPMCDTSHVIWF